MLLCDLDMHRSPFFFGMLCRAKGPCLGVSLLPKSVCVCVCVCVSTDMGAAVDFAACRALFGPGTARGLDDGKTPPNTLDAVDTLPSSSNHMHSHRKARCDNALRQGQASTLQSSGSTGGKRSRCLTQAGALETYIASAPHMRCASKRNPHPNRWGARPPSSPPPPPPPASLLAPLLHGPVPQHAHPVPNHP